MKRILLLLITLGICAAVSYFRFHSEEDLLVSLEDSHSERGQLFKALQEKNLLKDKIFLDLAALNEDQKERIDAFLQEHHYRPTKLLEASSPFSEALLLSADPKALQARLRPEAIEQRTQQILTLASLPSAGEAMQQIAEDPLGLKQDWFKTFSSLTAKANSMPAGAAIDLRVYQAPRPMNFKAIGEVYDRLFADTKLHMIGADFFAYENYFSIDRDSPFCVIIALVINLLLCGFFVRKWRFLVFAAVGTLASYVMGVFAMSLFFGKIYLVALAFTSTFLGFNLEYLVHLSGEERLSDRAVLKALSSAIGTTLIGFLILLFSDAIIIRQIAVVSIGGMLGFLGFLFVYSDQLRKIDFIPITWPLFRINRKIFMVAALALIAAYFFVDKPKLETRISNFRYQTQRLSQEVEYFKSLSQRADPTQIWAVPASYEDIKKAAISANLPIPFHPLQNYKSKDFQLKNLALLKAELQPAEARLQKSISRLGLNIRIPRTDLSQIRPMSEEAYTNEIENLSQQKWQTKISDRRYLYVFSKLAVPGLNMLAMGPEIYFNDFLTNLSRQALLLFGIGLVIMFAYLYFVHRHWLTTLAIFFPLAVAGLAYCFYFQSLGRGIHLIEVMGFLLVIGLALDYTSIAISMNYDRKHLTKVLFTGLSALGSFGVLMFATHPILRDLGRIVSLGVGISLLITLTTRFQVQE